MKVSKSILLHEIKLIAKDVEIIEGMGLSNKPETLVKLIENKLLSNYKPTADYINWLTDQVFNNNLPKNSSGSFETAIRDFDSFVCGFELEENADLYDFAEYHFKKLKI